MIYIARKGIATETIFYIVIGIVVIGILSVLVYNYSRNARQSGDCAIAENKYCELYSDAVRGGATDDATLRSTTWTEAKTATGSSCTATTGPSRRTCEGKGYDFTP